MNDTLKNKDLSNQIIPGVNIVQPRDRNDFVKGVTISIPYEIRRIDGDWSEDFGTYQPQRYGQWDSNCCWCLSGINSIEDQCNFLKRRGDFKKEALDWFTQNGYFDSQDNFAFSEQFIEILSGYGSGGGSQWHFWELVAQYGLLPRKDLTYVVPNPPEQSRIEFDKKYFNINQITETMRAKALKCLDYIQIQYQWIGKDNETPSYDELQTALKQSPLHIGIPVCMETYNSGNVKSCGLTKVAHAVELYKIESDSGIRRFFDQYEPHLKTLEQSYPIPYVTQGIVSAVPIVVIDNTFYHNFNVDLDYGSSNSSEIRLLQTALVKLGYLEPKYITGNFLDKTANALLRFQLDKKLLWSVILYWYKGHHFTTKSREAMNKIFKK